MTKPTRQSWKGVREIIHNRILNSAFRPGDKFPKDEDLATEFGCTRTTVQRAMRSLAEGGIVERKRKGGTRVRQDPITRATFEIPITRKEVESKGSVYRYQLIHATEKNTPQKIVANFGLAAPEKMLNVQCIHLADSNAYIYENRWISTNTVPEILKVDLTVESANEWLIRHRPYSRFDFRVYSINANSKYARVFDTDENQALLVFERTTWIEDKPITSVKAISSPGYHLIARGIK